MSIGIIDTFKEINVCHHNGTGLFQQIRMDILFIIFIVSPAVFQPRQLIKLRFTVQNLGLQCFATKNSRHCKSLFIPVIKIPISLIIHFIDRLICPNHIPLGVRHRNTENGSGLVSRLFVHLLIKPVILIRIVDQNRLIAGYRGSHDTASLRNHDTGTVKRYQCPILFLGSVPVPEGGSFRIGKSTPKFCQKQDRRPEILRIYHLIHKEKYLF